MFHTLSGRDEQMLMKLVVDGDSDRVVGCHILGAGRRRDGAKLPRLPFAWGQRKLISMPQWRCIRARPKNW